MLHAPCVGCRHACFHPARCDANPTGTPLPAAYVPPSPQVRSKILSEEFGWDKELAKKIWCFGPDTTGASWTGWEHGCVA